MIDMVCGFLAGLIVAAWVVVNAVTNLEKTYAERGFMEIDDVLYRLTEITP